MAQPRAFDWGSAVDELSADEYSAASFAERGIKEDIYVEESVETGTPEKDNTIPRGVLFELEYVALQGRKIIFDVVKAALKKENITLSVPMFSRYCVSGSPHDYIPSILDVNRKSAASADKLANAIVSETKSAFTKAKPGQNSCIQDILTVAEKYGSKVGALSVLGIDLAESLVEKLGLHKRGVVVKSSGSGHNGYTPPDAWIRLAKSIQVSSFQCIAIGSHAVSCRSAIAAHMRCVAVPDEFTSHQDFSGADRILDALDLDVLDDVIGSAPGLKS